MPRTKRRTVKRASSDMNMTYGNTTNQPKNIKEILEEFDSESNIQQHSFNFLYFFFLNLCYYFIFRKMH